MNFTIKSACNSNKGNVRYNNEDNYFFNGLILEENNPGNDDIKTETVPSSTLPLYGVFDGVGGGNYGEMASYTAANNCGRIKESCRSEGLSGADLVSELCVRLNNAVYDAKRSMTTDNMGSTAVAMYFENNIAYIGNLGDSRGYLFRGGELHQLSVDHSEPSIVLSATGRKRKGAVLQYLGMNSETVLVEPSVAECSLMPGDIFLICSDGLTDMVPEEEIVSILSETSEPDGKVSALTAKTMENGGRDNTTIILSEIKEDKSRNDGDASVIVSFADKAAFRRIQNNAEELASEARSQIIVQPQEKEVVGEVPDKAPNSEIIKNGKAQTKKTVKHERNIPTLLIVLLAVIAFAVAYFLSR